MCYKKYISIIVVLLSLLVCPGCTASWEEQIQTIQYADGKPEIYLSDEVYVIDDDLFMESWEKTNQIFRAESEMEESTLFVEKNVDEKYEEPFIYKDLLSYNPDTVMVEEYISVQNEGMIIVSYAIGRDIIYWMESNCDYSGKDPEWSVFSIETGTGKIDEIDNSDNYEMTAMLPMLHASGSKLVYIVGERVDDKRNHFIRLYEKGSNQVIFNIRNVKSPYVAPLADEQNVYYPEYFADGWYLLKYNLQDKDITRIEMPFLTDGEFPNAFAAKEDQIIYHSELNILYVFYTDTGEYKVIEDGGGGIDKGVLFGDKYYYIYNGELWRYNTVTQLKEIVYSKEHFWCNGISVANGNMVVSMLNSKENVNYYAVYE